MKREHEDIRFTTDSGKKVILKWEKNEYRAYEENGKELFLGATVPDNLILYIKKKI